MFGNIIDIHSNKLIIENKSKTVNTEDLNNYIIIEEEKRQIIGEIISINKENIKIELIGEINENKELSKGIVKKPSNNSLIRKITEEELKSILDTNQLDNLTIGKSVIYDKIEIPLLIDKFFSSHSAIIGNTGTGKSCAVTTILQNLFIKSNYKPVNAHIALFDAYGEYKDAFNEMNNINNLGFKKYTTKITNNDEELLKLPLYFLDVDDLAILLQVNDSEQLPVLEKTLKLVYIFKSKDEKAKEYKNDIIAKCLSDILTSGKSGSTMRDQIIAVLTHYNTETLNLNSIIVEPGYNRTLKQCLLIDEQGKMNAILRVTEFLRKFEKISLDNIEINNNFVYNLNDLYYALEFALISEGTLNSDLSYQQNNILKSRLQSLINSENAQIFDVKEYITKEEFIQNLFKKQDKSSAELIDINLEYLTDKFATIITKLYSKLFFSYTTSLINRGSFSINLILEEAHRYVINDTDTLVIGYNIFDRITKEGRKYGTLLTFITQRPSELSSTALSQCSNFICFKLFHPKDFEIVKSINNNISEYMEDTLKVLNKGTALIFGDAFKITSLVKFELPDVLPKSTSLKITELWYK